MSSSSNGDDFVNDSENEEELPIGVWNKISGKKKNLDSTVPIRKLYVSNLHGCARTVELKDLFSKFGTVVEAHIRCARQTYRRSTYYAFVTFESPESAEKAIRARRTQLKLNDRMLRVSPANAKHQPDKQEKKKLGAKHKFQTYVNRSDELEEYEADCGYRMGERKCLINDLNDDCLSLIFSHFEAKEKITVLELVCKRWRSVLLDQWLRVTHLDIEGSASIINLDDNMLGLMLQRCGKSLTKLTLPTTHKLSADTLHVIASLCRNLEHLSAHHLRVTMSAVNQLTMKCRQLKTLILRDPISIRDRDIRILFEKLNLETFSLKQRHIDGQCLSYLPLSLKHLDLTSCNDLTMPSLLYGLSRTPDLKTLLLINCVSLTKTDFESVCSKVPQLEEFSVAEYFPNLSGSALDSIKNLKNLKKLNLRLNDLVDDRLVTLISTSCKNLEVLDISGCNGAMNSNGVTDAGVKAIALNSNVTNLSMSYISRVTDVSLFHLAEAGRIKQLYCQGCPEISDTGCSRLISLCLELEFLDVSGCRNISSKTTNTAVEVVENFRSDAKKMHLIVGGTLVRPCDVKEASKGLKIDLSDNCIDRFRPDFSHDTLYASSTDEEEFDGLDLYSDDDYDPDDYDPDAYDFDSDYDVSDSDLQLWE